MADETILAKIHKLLALATSDNQNEAALAASKAQTMLIEHNISEDELNSFSSVKHEKVIEVRTPGKNGNNRSAWYSTLAHIVAKANLCTTLSSGPSIIWIGKQTNIEVAQYIFENLVNDLVQISDITWSVINAKQKEDGVYGYYRVHGKTWKNNFFHGANQAINERLNANLTQLKAADNVNALVVRNDIELKEFMKVKYPRTITLSNSLNLNRSGFTAGKEAGRQVQFRSGIGAGGSSGPKMLNRG